LSLIINDDRFTFAVSSPKWDENTSAEVLQQAERDSFLEWRRELAKYVFHLA
jgi:hypothetical protein